MRVCMRERDRERERDISSYGDERVLGVALQVEEGHGNNVETKVKLKLIYDAVGLTNTLKASHQRPGREREREGEREGEREREMYIKK